MPTHLETAFNSSSRLPTLSRVASGLGALTIAILIIVAALLTPSPDGIGTHRGIGLPPCQWIQLFGIRCPACGMTTSWAWMTRGEISNAAYANPAGALLFVQAAITTIVLTTWTISGKARNANTFGWFTTYYILIVLLIAIVNWGIRLKLG